MKAVMIFLVIAGLMIFIAAVVASGVAQAFEVVRPAVETQIAPKLRHQLIQVGQIEGAPLLGNQILKRICEKHQQ